MEKKEEKISKTGKYDNWFEIIIQLRDMYRYKRLRITRIEVTMDMYSQIYSDLIRLSRERNFGFDIRFHEIHNPNYKQFMIYDIVVRCNPFAHGGMLILSEGET